MDKPDPASLIRLHTDECGRILAASLIASRWAAFWTAVIFALVMWPAFPHEMLLFVPISYGVALLGWFALLSFVLSVGMWLVPRPERRTNWFWARLAALAAWLCIWYVTRFWSGPLAETLALIDAPLLLDGRISAAPLIFAMIGLWSGVSAGRSIRGEI